MSPFDDIESPTIGGNANGGSMEEFLGGNAAASDYMNVQRDAQEFVGEKCADSEEDDALSIFNRERDMRLKELSLTHEKIGLQRKEQAQSTLQAFVSEREIRTESKRAANHAKEEATLEKLDADLKNENPWERVVTLIDLDLSRRNKNKSDKAVSKKETLQLKNQKNQDDSQKYKTDVTEVSRMRQLLLQLKCEPQVTCT